MGKTGTRVRAPRAPKGEDPKVTIANQDKQIRLLTDRIVDLAAARDRAQKLSDENYENGKAWRNEHKGLERDLIMEREQLAHVRAEMDYQRGYIARVKEEDGHRYGDLPK